MPLYRLTILRKEVEDVIVEADSKGEAEEMFFGGDYERVVGSETTLDLEVTYIQEEDE